MTREPTAMGSVRGASESDINLILADNPTGSSVNILLSFNRFEFETIDQVAKLGLNYLLNDNAVRKILFRHLSSCSIAVNGD